MYAGRVDKPGKCLVTISIWPLEMDYIILSRKKHGPFTLQIFARYFLFNHFSVPATLDIGRLERKLIGNTRLITVL